MSFLIIKIYIRVIAFYLEFVSNVLKIGFSKFRNSEMFSLVKLKVTLSLRKDKILD